MACPNRDNDKRILAEIERRKKNKENHTPQFTAIAFNGSIDDLTLKIHEDSIKNVRRIGDGIWEITVKNY